MQLYKIYKKGNYIYFEYADSAGKITKKRYSALYLTYEKEDSFFKINHKIKGIVLVVEVNSGLDELGTPYTEAQLETFLDENTSHLGSAGGGGAGDASASNQVLQTTVLNNILLELKDDINATETVWYDKVTPTLFYVRRSSTNQDTGVVIVSFYDVAGVLATPIIANLVQVVSGTDYEFNTIQRKAITAGVGYSVNDRIQELQIINMSLAALVNTIWVNKTTDTIIATPTFSHLIVDDSYSNSANQALQITEALLTNTTLGQKADLVATTDVGTFSLISFVKRGLSNWTTFLNKFKSVAPISTDSGLVTRNIPSGIQEVKLNEVTENVTEGTQNGVYVAQKTIKWYDSVSQALIQTTFEYVDKDGNIVATPTNFIPTIATSTKSLQEAQLSTLDDIDVKLDKLDTSVNPFNVNIVNSQGTTTTMDLKTLVENGNNVGTIFCKLTPSSGHKTYTISFVKTGLAGSVGVYNTVDGIEYKYENIYDVTTGKRVSGSSIGVSGQYLINVNGVDEIYLKTESFFSANINASAKLTQGNNQEGAIVVDSSNQNSFLEKDNSGNLKVTQPAMFSIQAGGDSSAGNTPFGVISLSGQNTVSFRVSGTWTATLKPLLFIAGGDVTPRIYDIATGNEIIGGITTNGTYAIQTYGATSCSFVANPLTSGQVDVGYISTPASFEFKTTVLANRTETQTGSIASSADIAPTAGQKIKTLTFTNNTGAVIFLQIHNKATALALADVPLNGLIFRVPANSTLDKTAADFGEAGILYGANTRIGLSSTFGTYTAITPTNTSINIITIT